MNIILKWWGNVSIIRKLYFVITAMAILIASELAVLRFAMHTLSAARAFVGGESSWSKAQKDALQNLLLFGIERDERAYADFLNDFRVPMGDHQARIALEKPVPGITKAREGFLAGRVHPDDIPPVIDLLRHFYWVRYMKRAIEYWRQGDLLLEKFHSLGVAYHSAVVDRRIGEARKMLAQISALNLQLTALEENFSDALGEGCRWLEKIILSILSMIVLTVESFGLTLAFVISRQLSRGLKRLETVSHEIGCGQLSSRVENLTADELSQLGKAINQMGEMLQHSYGNLESRVKEAVATRDEFISVVSHELRSPLTSLSLQMDIFMNQVKSRAPPDKTGFEQMAETMCRQLRKLTTLLDRLLDLTRIRTGQFVVRLERVNLSTIVKDAVGLMVAEAKRVGSEIRVTECTDIVGHFDSTRIYEVIVNLISNAIKYGGGKPIEVKLTAQSNFAVIAVQDRGPGIPAESQTKMFQRFQRGSIDSDLPGVGLGLYISKQIVQAHNGAIKVTSEPGEGTEFSVHLPINGASIK